MTGRKLYLLNCDDKVADEATQKLCESQTAQVMHPEVALVHMSPDEPFHLVCVNVGREERELLLTAARDFDAEAFEVSAEESSDVGDDNRSRFVLQFFAVSKSAQEETESVVSG